VFTTGTGWVLSVPDELMESAKACCAGLSFYELTSEGDRLGQEWFDGGAHENPNMSRTEVSGGYEVMNALASELHIRGWSHYMISYADASWQPSSRDEHVCGISAELPDLWEQWQNWPGPMCGPRISKGSPVADAFGYVLDGKLVSVGQLDAHPDELEWEYGVDTLPEYRSRGFATSVLKRVTSHIIEQGHVPWHYTDHYNSPSRRLPDKLGYFPYGEGLFSAA
jgi:RimJ/RimL family protein N-acetyltransferase